MDEREDRDEWPEDLQRRREIGHLLADFVARRRTWTWSPEVLSIYHSSSAGPSGGKGQRRAIELIFADGIFTLRIPPELLSEAAAARVLSTRTGFSWSQDDDRRSRGRRALCKDYLPADTREAADDIAWLMYVLWKALLARPLRWHAGTAAELAGRTAT